MTIRVLDTDGEFVRGVPPIDEGDVIIFRKEIERINAQSVLEFGPGESTQVFLDLGVGRVVTCEHKDRWLKVAQERFANEPRVKVLSYTDTLPVEVPELNGEKFDLALVDSPQGFKPMRVAHPGMEDCSRLNTCLFALEHAKVVLLHDATRPLERGTLGRLNAMGYDVRLVAINKIGLGTARIEKCELHEDQSDSQDATQSGSLAAGPESECGRGGVDRRVDRLGSGGFEAQEHSGRGAIVHDADDSNGVSDSARSHRGKRRSKRVRSDERNGIVHALPEG